MRRVGSIPLGTPDIGRIELRQCLTSEVFTLMRDLTYCRGASQRRDINIILT